MATVVFVVLAVIWAAVLIPPVIRRRSEIQPNDSIVDFRRRLGVLQRTTPLSVEPAFRLGDSQTSIATHNQAYNRRVSQRRRRDILTGLVGLCVSTLVIGLIPAFRVVLYVNVVADILLVAYVALLVQMKNRANERRQKLRTLPVANANRSHDENVTEIRSAQVQ